MCIWRTRLKCPPTYDDVGQDLVHYYDVTALCMWPSKDADPVLRPSIHPSHSRWDRLVICKLTFFFPPNVQLSNRCPSSRNADRLQYQWNWPTWRQRGADPTISCWLSSAWLTAWWPVGGTLTWLTPTWRSFWRLVPQWESYWEGKTWSNPLPLTFDLFVFCSAPPSAAVWGPRGHGCLAQFVVPPGGRVGGAAGVNGPVTLPYSVRQECAAVMACKSVIVFLYFIKVCCKEL